MPVILSGGVDSCLWPLSREHFPKQCLPLIDTQYSLLQQTAKRVSSLDMSPPIIVCNEDRRFLVAQQLQEIGVDARSGLMHSLSMTAANVHDITETKKLLHGEEAFISADSGYRGAQKREELNISGQIDWLITLFIKKSQARCVF